MQLLSRSIPPEQPPTPDKLSPRYFPTRKGYSPAVELAFAALKYFFLFLAGFTIAHILSASLGASQIVELLFGLFTFCLKPLAALTFCIVALVALVESLK